jgi:hypothetical protein
LIDDMNASLHGLRVQTVGRDASAVASWGDRIPMDPTNERTLFPVKGRTPRCLEHGVTLRGFV